MWKRILNNTEILLAILLVLLGLGLLFWNKPDAAAIATLVGALFGASALLLGNLINRHNEARRAEESLTVRSDNLKALIAAELVQVSVTLITAKEMVDAALTTINSGGVVPSQINLTEYYPYHMPLTVGLGSELLILEKPAIDALVTLQGDLAITEMGMESISTGQTIFGRLSATSLSNGLRHNMAVLAKAFEHIAPNRQLRLPGKEAELATAIFQRMSD